MTHTHTVETGIKKKNIITYIMSNSVSDSTSYSANTSVVSITDDGVLDVLLTVSGGGGLWYAIVTTTISVIYIK